MPQIQSGPVAPPNGSRTAYIASRAVGGAVAAQVLNFLKATVAYLPLSQAPPAISDHWAVLVGDTIYELQSPGGYVSYQKSEKSMLGRWQIYEMGYTSYSDDDIDSSGNKARDAIREMPQEYHAVDNNCQTFALALLDKISMRRHRLRTSYSPTSPC